MNLKLAEQDERDILFLPMNHLFNFLVYYNNKYGYQESYDTHGLHTKFSIIFEQKSTYNNVLLSDFTENFF